MFSVIRGQPITLLFLPIMLCCSALKMPKNRNYCQTIILFIIMQFYMRNSLHVADNFIITVLLECIIERYRSIPLCSIIMMTVLLEYIDLSLQFSTSAEYCY